MNKIKSIAMILFMLCVIIGFFLMTSYALKELLFKQTRRNKTMKTEQLRKKIISMLETELDKTIWYSDKINSKLTAILKEEVDALLKELKEAIADSEGLDCPDCGNIGITVKRYTGEGKPCPCEYCLTVKGSKFRIKNFKLGQEDN